MSWLLSSNIKLNILTRANLCALALLIGCNQDEPQEESREGRLKFEELSVANDGSVEG